jgi:hypothetical protein
LQSLFKGREIKFFGLFSATQASKMRQLLHFIGAIIIGGLLVLCNVIKVHAQPATPDTLKLKMISGTEQRRAATINNETFLAGEKHTILLNNKKVVVECVEIREQSALVRIAGEATPRELKLGKVEAGTFKSVINPVEVVFTNLNFAISVPGGWQWEDVSKPDPDVLAAYVSPDKTGFLIIGFYEAQNKSVQVDHRFVAVAEKKLSDDGEGAALSATFKKIGGVDGYERFGMMLFQGKHAPTLTDLVAADGKIYIVHMIRLNGHPDKDPEFRKCLSSFRFLTRPRS